MVAGGNMSDDAVFSPQLVVSPTDQVDKNTSKDENAVVMTGTLVKRAGIHSNLLLIICI